MSGTLAGVTSLGSEATLYGKMAKLVAKSVLSALVFTHPPSYELRVILVLLALLVVAQSDGRIEGLDPLAHLRL